MDVESARSSLGWLADSLAPVRHIDVAGLSQTQLSEQFERMLLIRRAEEAISELVTSGEARCPCHLAIGQEACAVGIAAAFDRARGDRAFGAHRSHGHYLALGGDLDALMAEVLGRASGCSRGMGGSMHLVAPEHGLLGTVPIVSATIPMAVGAALASRLEGSTALAVAFFGDGATEEGVFHEAMNMASLWALPVVFVCENNLFSSHLHIRFRQPDNSVARYADAHVVTSEVLDGNDVCAVVAAARRAAERARDGDGPTMLELVTYRWRGHVGPSEDIDVGVRRSEDLPAWKKRDPIQRLRDAMVVAGMMTETEADGADQQVTHRVREAVERARTAPYPESDTVDRYLFASSANGQ
ncbi:MAG: thiamine pyrophosphate-dependent dehydrogenase E1 component subunit alpha [Gemmatimonadaceae bacterium]